MADLLATLVTFTEPFVIGGYALLLAMTFDICISERKLIALAPTRSHAQIALLSFVLVAVSGTTAEYLASFVLEETGLHDGVIQLSLEERREDGEALILIETVCPRLKRFTERDLQGILYEAPWGAGYGAHKSNNIERATYSVRLLRGVCLVSLIASLSVFLFATVELLIGMSENAHRQTRSLLFSLTTLIVAGCSYLGWEGAEQEFHRAMRYESLRFLLLNERAVDLCHSLPSGNEESGKISREFLKEIERIRGPKAASQN